MELHIQTPEANIYKGSANAVTMPGTDGTFQVLQNHAPLIASLKAGEVKVVTDSGIKTFSIGSGFVEVLNNKITLLAESPA
ncbi:MAG: F0F1 ATP synthase subunit epsilon [Chitinophagales bacterium]|nr:F0F1 ATP synthase subunit epsilon [Bacteroidota bacterium]MCB9043344.1 F0F1 ATP synthase subunit epsilon [Chitinophagales bacterium]